MEGPSVKQCILEVAQRFVTEAQAQQDGDLYLVIDVHCDANRGIKQMQWDVVSRGALAEEARRHFDQILLLLICTRCGNIFELMEGTVACPSCGSDCLTVAEREGRLQKTTE